LVVAKTAGRLVSNSAFKVGFGYRVALPDAAYITWKGTNLEGRGLVPNIEETLSPEALWSGEDNQLKRAVDCLKEAASAA
jgi:C-terminal processing protease CtpA/Prc